MSMLRNVLTYMGLGPDEDYDDGYLNDGPADRTRRSTGRRVPEPARDEITVEPDDEAGPLAPAGPRDEPAAEPHGHGRDDRYGSDDRSEPVGDGPGLAPSGSESVAGRPASGLRAELRSRVAATRPLRAVPPAALAPQEPVRDGPADLVQPENGITVRTVVVEAEADMVYDTGPVGSPGPSRAGPAPLAPSRSVAPRFLSPSSFGDAKILADGFKSGTPVVMNLHGIERDLARRLIDFASGICYALDGSMEKLAPQVFLLTPPTVELSEHDRRRLEQRDYSR